MTTQKRNTKKLVVGDQVIEEKHFADHCISKDHPDFNRVARIVRNRRVGEVVELVVKKDSRGHAINYAMVLWNEYKSPRLHHVMRLRKLSEESQKQHIAS
ncbi:MAG TPA: hypothetical protein DEP13_04605 [Gammaproteobacteria bacterium]|nr:MAG: hypothetical protein CBD74_01740 [Saprospirales bacterium TMED214]HCA35907.1 hypothetical protein [Gammaproteobacteria bacterium]